MNKESLDTKLKEIQEKLETYKKEGDAKLLDEEQKLGEGKIDDEEDYEEERD